MELWSGVLGVIILLAAAFAQWRARSARATIGLRLVAVLGWSLVVHFLIAPLVPAEVVAFVVLGAIVAGILVAALIGALKARRETASGRRQD